MLRRQVSTVAEGVLLRGLNIYKNGVAPKALPDSEYPEWLWKISLKKSETEHDVGSHRTQKWQKAQNKARIKASNQLKSI